MAWLTLQGASPLTRTGGDQLADSVVVGGGPRALLVDQEASESECPLPLPTITSRGMIPRVFLIPEQVRTVVELGVDAGGFSEFLLMHCDSCEQYNMVDLWGRSDAGQVRTTPTFVGLRVWVCVLEG